MTVNPLVAARVDEPKSAWAGVWIAEDIELIAQGVRNGSWIDGTLGTVSAGLDGLALVSDPVGALLQYGIAWLIEHVKPLSEALDWLAGDPAQIAAHAQTWRNVAGGLRDQAEELSRSVRRDVGEWTGAAAAAYRTWSHERAQTLQTLAAASDTLALMTEGAGLLIGTVRIMVRDAVATVVSRLIVYAGELIATAGLATPLVIEQVATLCASWAARIARWLRSLIASLRKLGDDMRRLGDCIEKLKKQPRGAQGVPLSSEGGLRQTGSELRKPKSDLDFEIHWADEAYARIRSSDDDIAAVAKSAEQFGFSAEDIRIIKDHVFRDEHVLDTYPPPEIRRFDANPRMAEAWLRLETGAPHPSDLDLLAHERFEALHMAATGDRSYSRAHAATIAAGHTWHSEAAAAAGLGHQRSR